MRLLEFPKPAPEQTISEMLRALADTFEREGQPDVLVYVTTGDTGLMTGLMGYTDEVHATGLLTIGASFMAAEAVGE